ncbi:aldo/keto reductase [Alteromonas naphthalenivorans]|uniref:NADPH-dependent aldose reductase n=1 Tax=Alteromonas naphthalenivorans TaxID=715451 RepID=F5ZA00_ALTNA|nr:aldo/keto reductase [Alteromonas naphthalenivorans]AEF01614.1 putative NADPH-dependent aldose reductase [Alteromonas naphthalenivorans]
MQFNKLGGSDLSVSDICLGTMTWGIQNTQQDADEQLAMAIDHGVNFIDTAEMYPVPPNDKTYGDTERILGNWLARNPAARNSLVIMTKVAGSGLSYIRDGGPITSHAVEVALDNSLSRLNTDYVDVYQLHWPNRVTPHFGKHWPDRANPIKINKQQEIEGMRDILSGIKKALDAGKIRHWGLSDDTPWGIHTFLTLCKEMNIPFPVSIQNEFSLLHLKDWPYLIETCVLEDIAYLPWSPLATGMLSGKYMNGDRPKGSRWTLVQRQGLFRDKEPAREATARYVEIAKRAKITPSQLALAWCKQVPGVTSTIIGATTTEQLAENLSAFSLNLDESTLKQIGEVVRRHPLGY